MVTIQRIRNIIIILLAAIQLSACGDNAQNGLTKSWLRRADSLLDKEMTDSAACVFGRIMPSDITNDEERAMYNLLATHLDYLNYNKVENDSAIDFSIAYFTKTGDLRHLTDAWFYKAVTNYDRGNTAVAMKYLKKAEYEARELNDTAKLHKTIEQLSYVNSEQGEYEQSLHYNRENLKLCMECGNKNWTACTITNLAVIYSRMGNADSMYHYYKASHEYLRYISPKHRATFLANEANTYLDKNPEKAETTFRKALKIHPTTTSYMGLAELYLQRNDTTNAENMFGKAFNIAKEDIKINILKRWAAMHEQTGQTERFKQDMHRIISLQDSLHETRAKNNIINIQHEYDHRIRQQNDRQRYKNNNIMIAAGAMVMIAIIVTVSIFIAMRQKNKQSESRKRIAENQIIIEQYLRRITELEQQCKTSIDDTGNKQKEIDSLHKRINALRQHQAELLYRGKTLCNDIRNGGTVSLWNKKDYEAFIEYYRMQDPAFVHMLENDYNRLSARNMVFEILLHENYPQEEIQHIFAIEPSTFRANKARNNAKKKSAPKPPGPQNN